MSYLTENPELMLEVLAVMVRRAGGSVEISGEEAPGPFNLSSKVDHAGKLYLYLDENLTADDVNRINGHGYQ